MITITMRQFRPELVLLFVLLITQVPEIFSKNCSDDESKDCCVQTSPCEEGYFNVNSCDIVASSLYPTASASTETTPSTDAESTLSTDAATTPSTDAATTTSTSSTTTHSTNATTTLSTKATTTPSTNAATTTTSTKATITPSKKATTTTATNKTATNLTNSLMEEDVESPTKNGNVLIRKSLNITTTTRINTHSQMHIALGPTHSVNRTTLRPTQVLNRTTLGPKHFVHHTTLGPTHSVNGTTLGPKHSVNRTSMGPTYYVSRTTLGSTHTVHRSTKGRSKKQLNYDTSTERSTETHITADNMGVSGTPAPKLVHCRRCPSDCRKCDSSGCEECEPGFAVDKELCVSNIDHSIAYAVGGAVGGVVVVSVIVVVAIVLVHRRRKKKKVKMAPDVLNLDVRGASREEDDASDTSETRYAELPAARPVHQRTQFNEVYENQEVIDINTVDTPPSPQENVRGWQNEKRSNTDLTDYSIDSQEVYINDEVIEKLRLSQTDKTSDIEDEQTYYNDAVYQNYDFQLTNEESD